MFPEILHFNVAPYIDTFVEWLKIVCAPAFDLFSEVLLAVLLKIEAALLIIPWWAWIAVVVAVYWWQTRRPVYALALGALLMTVGFFGLWTVAMKTLAIIVAAVVISLLFGIPAGIAMAESDRLNIVLTPLLDAMQTMPSFVYLIPAMMFFGLGKVPATVATVIYALPPVIRLTNLGIRQVPATIQEAALAFGATRWQLMREIFVCRWPCPP